MEKNKLEIIKSALFEYLTKTKKHNFTLEMWQDCFLKRGKRKGFLRDKLPQDHKAYGLLLALQLDANVYKFNVGAALFLQGEQFELFNALKEDLSKQSKFVQCLDFDRTVLESIKAW